MATLYLHLTVSIHVVVSLGIQLILQHRGTQQGKGTIAKDHTMLFSTLLKHQNTSHVFIDPIITTQVHNGSLNVSKHIHACVECKNTNFAHVFNKFTTQGTIILAH
jgi:hypothetical protein